VTLASPDVIEYLVKCDSDSSGDYQRRCCARRSSPPDKWARTKSGGPSDRPFCCANCDDGHGAARGVVLKQTQGLGTRSFQDVLSPTAT
jgi:hypothetical protein